MKTVFLLITLSLPNLVFGGDIVNLHNGQNYRGTQFQTRTSPRGIYTYQNGRYTGQTVGSNYLRATPSNYVPRYVPSTLHRPYGATTSPYSGRASYQGPTRKYSR